MLKQNICDLSIYLQSFPYVCWENPIAEKSGHDWYNWVIPEIFIIYQVKIMVVLAFPYDFLFTLEAF